jgi:hypothetical protein
MPDRENKRHSKEFAFHSVPASEAAKGEVDATLQLMGSLGWSIAAMTLQDANLIIALERAGADELHLPESNVISAKLQEPLTGPATAEQP